MDVTSKSSTVCFEKNNSKKLVENFICEERSRNIVERTKNTTIFTYFIFL
ncbi:hypothetical protein MNB_SM-6-1414 [hydrothermal vent metagenome]|uniref:Uncharacterized protein n=1 Tax=hydrothermal vent metagenome TaxID=652676 RepID=A0A1W1C749_9ZZZZ